jgi:hypothetical protein
MLRDVGSGLRRRRMQNIPASATTPRSVDLQNSDSAACTCYRNFPIAVDREAEA